VGQQTREGEVTSGDPKHMTMRVHRIFYPGSVFFFEQTSIGDLTLEIPAGTTILEEMDHGISLIITKRKLIPKHAIASYSIYSKIV